MLKRSGVSPALAPYQTYTVSASAILPSVFASHTKHAKYNLPNGVNCNLQWAGIGPRDPALRCAQISGTALLHCPPTLPVESGKWYSDVGAQDEMPDQSKPSQEGGERIPDANLSRINVSGNAAGLIFTLGVLAMFLAGLPQARWFLAVSLPAGLIVALVLRWTARDRD